MLNPTTFILVSVFCFAIWGFYTWRLNSLALRRDSDSPANTPYWIKKFENISGPGIVIYSLTMTAVVIYWVMSMDVTCTPRSMGCSSSSARATQCSRFSIIVSISLSKAEPFKTILRQTEQHDMGQAHLRLRHAQHLPGLRAVPHHLVGKFCLKKFPGTSIAFAATGGVIITLDFMFHWLIPFTMLLSRDISATRSASSASASG